MLIKVTIVILLSRFPNKISCLGNSNACEPGQVTNDRCSHCVCRDSGQYECKNTCGDKLDSHPSLPLHCTPFNIYYISCKICLCPASGRFEDARCVLDISCTFSSEPSIAEISLRKARCIPNVQYQYSCRHCICSDDGYFIKKKCVDICRQNKIETRKCIPNTLYRKGCKVCLCPANSIADDKHCTNNTCGGKVEFNLLSMLKGKQTQCTPYDFTKPRCLYCDCTVEGAIDDRSCLELDCLQHDSLKTDLRNTCSPGEVVPFCLECLCTKDSTAPEEYCTKTCSYPNKLRILDKVVTNPNLYSIIDTESIMKSDDEDCTPNTVYVNRGRVCICTEDGITIYDMCTQATYAKKFSHADSVRSSRYTLNIDFSGHCEPNTFVHFECNTCVCSKTGEIDPKWCTQDDCEAKRIIQESSKAQQNSEIKMPGTCKPGSVYNVDCNFCICPESGLIEDRVCTKNNCTIKQAEKKFSCDPLAYYEVDCNICYCPKDGIQDVARCTKNLCDSKSLFLRSESCRAGKLFSEECNVCVCPADGDKERRACTNYTCADPAPWRTIMHLSDSLLGHQLIRQQVPDLVLPRSLERCVPGEEYHEGNRVCLCPDLGLTMYAECFSYQDQQNGEIGSGEDITLRNLRSLYKINTRY